MRARHRKTDLLQRPGGIKARDARWGHPFMMQQAAPVAQQLGLHLSLHPLRPHPAPPPTPRDPLQWRTTSLQQTLRREA